MVCDRNRHLARHVIAAAAVSLWCADVGSTRASWRCRSASLILPTVPPRDSS